MRVYGFDELPSGDKQLHTYDIGVGLLLNMLLEKLELELEVDKRGKPVLERKN